MKRKTIYLLAVVIGLFSACTDNGFCIKGDGHVREYVLEVEDFDAVALSGPIDLTIVQGETASAKIMAESQVMEVLEYDVRGGELMVGFKGKVRCFDTTKGVRVIATVPDIHKVIIDGVSEVENVGNLTLGDFTLECHGKGEVALTGTVDRQFFIVDGDIEVENYGLLSRETSIEVNGRGDFEVSCSDILDIDVDGKADVSYKGHPVITRKVNGALDLDDAN